MPKPVTRSAAFQGVKWTPPPAEKSCKVTLPGSWAEGGQQLLQILLHVLLSFPPTPTPQALVLALSDSEAPPDDFRKSC